MKNKFDLNDILDCYCKMKRDMFYEPMNISFLDIAEYEKNLHNNLSRFTEKLNEQDATYFLTDEFIGGVHFAPKKVIFHKHNKEKTNVFKSSDFQFDNEIIDSIETRKLGDLSVEFHLLSSVWIEYIGKRFDIDFPEALKGGRTENKYADSSFYWERVSGNTRHTEHQFKYYPKEYKSWQQGAITKAKELVQENYRCYIFSFDLQKFYYKIDAFEIIKGIHELFKLGLTPNYFFLNDILHESIKIWALKHYDDSTGLPIGLGASKIIANIALLNFDHAILSNSEIKSYGRYIDDIILTFSTDLEIETANDVWNYLNEILGNEDGIISVSSNGQFKVLDFPVNHDKDRLYVLEGDSGDEFLQQVTDELEKNSSEWRHFLEPERDAKELKDTLLNLENIDDDINAITGVSESTLKRRNFGIKRRRYEQLVRLGMIKEFDAEIESFYEISKNHLFTLANLGDYWKQMIQVIGLTLASGHFKYWVLLNEKMNGLFDQLIQTPIKVDNYNLIEFMRKKIFEEECRCLSPGAANTHIIDDQEAEFFQNLYSIQERSIELYLADLHFLPLNQELIKKENVIDKWMEGQESTNSVLKAFENKRIQELVKWLDK